MSTLKEIEQRQEKMYKLIDQMNAQEDMTKMLEIVKLLEDEAHGLENAALAFQAKMQKETAKSKRPIFEVVLTPEQRSRILKETGVDMASVWIEDQSGARNVAMPMTSKDEIEKEALRQAKEQAALKPAKENAKRMIEDQLNAVAEQSPLHAELVANVRADPRFQEAVNFDKKYI